MNRRIGVGIIGCGKIAQMRHLPEYAANPNAVLAGYYDLNRGRAEELAREYGGKAYADYHALLADPPTISTRVFRLRRWKPGNTCFVKSRWRRRLRIARRW